MAALKAVVPKPAAIIIDFEGGVVPRHYFAEKMRPYVMANLKKFIVVNWKHVALQEIIEGVRNMHQSNDPIEQIPRPNGSNDNEQMRTLYYAVEYYQKSKERRHETPLMALDLLIWIDAFKAGDLVTPIFPDVIDCLHIWKRGYGIPLYTYSSGPEELPRLMLASTDKGFALGAFSGVFGGRRIGPKSEEMTWKKIVRTLKVKSEELLFISKKPREAKVAAKLGIRCLISCKKDNLEKVKQANKGVFAIVKNFYDIEFE